MNEIVLKYIECKQNITRLDKELSNIKKPTFVKKSTYAIKPNHPLYIQLKDSRIVECGYNQFIVYIGDVQIMLGKNSIIEIPVEDKGYNNKMEEYNKQINSIMGNKIVNIKTLMDIEHTIINKKVRVPTYKNSKVHMNIDEINKDGWIKLSWTEHNTVSCMCEGLTEPHVYTYDAKKKLNVKLTDVVFV